MYNILDFNIDELKKWMKKNEQSGFRAAQVMDWIYKNNIWSFDEMKNVPTALRELLKKNFYIGIPELLNCYESSKKDTTKFLYRYEDGNVIETVVMKYNRGNSICVSTQVGCRMGCSFCASTIDGMVRNLSSGEIIAQILISQKIIKDRISNVVLMGSGEPLDNYDNVIRFIDVVNSDYSLNIGQRHITLSTCGIVPKIIELAEKNLQITLAISLHSPEDDLRKQMMPVANKYSIEEIIEACSYYIGKTGRRVSFEYALVKGVNDSDRHADELSEILKGILCHVNLIPINDVKEKNYIKSSRKDIEKFSNVLSRNGIETTIRKEMGADIDAACGQLRRSYLESKKE
ncbi:MAG: 23S rRNA (adenine(2503)-C(2))-methyltransferase RlmN [Clostridium sp.]|jgi:23S rRNA (adenine2503-C2)-methyltransferase|uniref:23S rRNA (adenine(2503)-C(2))-methyltransferase RlmN n=1 Tax=Clostridium sp. TaxID=1506 RepID=UPI0025B9364E|nr:23S rRNA (adenine(2503)-C(2))-methyltransferase RlmN [Clostridium sp.]MCH3964038.1 23S rRNA (adenine(2503)-C(2))-methyltransferase RlmN [Clostridium sp.]MCI1716239.1 23S rRNA (adenine(2503)-C(2))-methyltransferase RlmN [Clostridium sp.]MCI1800521.1 23S rRNA (adenine(2503)-C(2))-methyltransferase RlmN [Clostridium sp.]MCI1814416.1 23S rRNA (adenine(2503)-C(2))-methyltransferase RlmN [Clostridium sp.]MCI1871315.1 23S rRNA (adenine(2503)-C(2))-methyltransferase RlmN [Clostridium sp.]